MGNQTNKEIVICSIITAMSTSLNSQQMKQLDDVLRQKMHGLKLEEENTEVSTWSDDNGYIIKMFLASKKLIGCKNGSLEQYALSIRQFLR